MNSDKESKPEPIDPDDTTRVLELELMRQRAARQQAGSPYRGLRAISLVFFVAVVLAAMVAFFYLIQSGSLERLRNNPSSVTTSPAP